MFYFTFPVISEQVVLLDPLVFLAIALMLLFLLYISTPMKEYHIEVPSELHEHSELIRSKAPYFYDAWYGQLPLWQVFWPFCVLLNVLLAGGDWLVRNTAFSVPSWDTLLLTCMTTTIWWTIATWRNVNLYASPDLGSRRSACDLSSLFGFWFSCVYSN